MNDSSKLWGGRFTEKPDETFARFNNSFRFDQRLFAADVRASIAHANGLEGAGVLTADERSSIVAELESMLERSTSDEKFFESDAEDVHSFIESRLVEAIGDTGKKVHTGRSRNDQVATAFRLWLREEIDAIDRMIIRTQKSLLD